MIIGITGTQQGLSRQQVEALTSFVHGCSHVIDEVHHGDCIGADEQVVKIITGIDRQLLVVCHPPDIDDKRAWVESDLVQHPRPYLKRNHDIVDAVDALWVFPAGEEQQRSGTWATARYARSINLPLLIFKPSGGLDNRLYLV